MTVAFGGCFADEGKTASTKSPTAAEAGANNTTAALVNTAPVASFTISFNGTPLVADNGSIVAPANENLTFDASNSTDAEGGNLTYTWDFDGNGTADGAVVTYSFNETGNQTIVLTVTDDGGLAATANVTLVVGSSGPAAGTWLREDAQSFGNANYPTYLVNNGCGPKLSKPWVLVDKEENGTASTVGTLKVTIAAMSYNLQVGGTTKIWFFGPDGKVLAANEAAGIAAKTLTVPGPLPAGTYKVEGQICAATVAATSGTGNSAVSGVATYVSV